MNQPASVSRKIRNLGALLGACLLFVYVFLAFLTESVPILNRMSRYLDNNGIDPTRYYYTDVEQVKESEQYLQEVLNR